MGIAIIPQTELRAVLTMQAVTLASMASTGKLDVAYCAGYRDSLLAIAELLHDKDDLIRVLSYVQGSDYPPLKSIEIVNSRKLLAT